MEDTEVAPAPERFEAALSVLVTPDQKAWVESAAGDRQSSSGAIVRAAIEAYRRLHPTLGRG